MFVPTFGPASKWTDSESSYDDSMSYDANELAIYAVMDDVQRQMWESMRSALKTGTLSGTANEPNEDFGLRPSTLRGISQLFQAGNTVSSKVRAFQEFRHYWWDDEQEDMTYSWWNEHESRLRDNQSHYESGVPNRTFGYRIIALGLTLLLHGSGNDADELENLENAFRLMKQEPRDKFSKWIFYLSCGMEKGNRPVAAEEMMMRELIERLDLHGPPPPMHQPSQWSNDDDSHGSGDTTVDMSVALHPPTPVGSNRLA
jgi:hypothetical protein